MYYLIHNLIPKLVNYIDKKTAKKKANGKRNRQGSCAVNEELSNKSKHFNYNRINEAYTVT